MMWRDPFHTNGIGAERTLGLLLVLAAWLVTASPTMAAPAIHNVTAETTGSTYRKYEISFEVDTVASNLQVPYDLQPSIGINPNLNDAFDGVSVDAVFTAPDGQTYRQPAFIYYDYQDAIKQDDFGADKEWFYRTGQDAWKVRFAPHIAGMWQVHIEAKDRTGNTASAHQSFEVSDSGDHGFIRVSSHDNRYFVFDDETYFPGIGYNMNYNQVAWVNPTIDNEENFVVMQQNGIQLVRTWLSEWSIFGSGWNAWQSVRGDGVPGTYMPRSGMITHGTDQDPYATLGLSYVSDSGNLLSWFEPCRVISGHHAPTALKQGATYQISVTYRSEGMTGPRVAGMDYGLVVKLQNPNDGNWHTNCAEPNAPTSGVPIMSPYGKDTNGALATISTTHTFGNTNFLPTMYLALENTVDNGSNLIEIADIRIQEVLNGGSLGPNLLSQGSMQMLTTFNDRNAYAFDKVLELADQHDIYFRLTMMEKNDSLMTELNLNGTKGDVDPSNPNGLFYGDGRNPSALRWMQRAWWRYAQARWGYSPHVHTWELTNEGDSSHGDHYALADEMAQYMHCEVFGVSTSDGTRCAYDHPNAHLTTTSTWGGWPDTDFWGNDYFAEIDYANIHQYISKNSDSVHFYDLARSVIDLNASIGKGGTGWVNKPIVRGETGLTDNGTEPGTRDLLTKDPNALWLHNYLWAQLGSGGVIETGYWYTDYEWGGVRYGHLYNGGFDHRPSFKPFTDFLSNIPMANGHYVDLQAGFNQSNLRVIGQKDTANNRAHVWIQNSGHTWNSPTATAVSDTITIGGFSPNTSLPVEQWDTYLGTITDRSSKTTNGNGILSLSVSNLTTDVAYKIGDYTTVTPPPDLFDPDIDDDLDVDWWDLSALIDKLRQGASSIFQYATVVEYFGVHI